MTNFVIDIEGEATNFSHDFESCIGCGHAYNLLRADNREYLIRICSELGFTYVRFFGIFDDVMHLCLQHVNKAGEREQFYNFRNCDNILDFLLSIHVKPYIELGFMPVCLASGREQSLYYNSNITPPGNYNNWGRLVYEFASHIIERYGIDEVSEWLFGVWTEPDNKAFFSGSMKEYFTLYEVSVIALKQASRKLKIGGPSTSNNRWLNDFLNYCAENSVPADFVTAHANPYSSVISNEGETDSIYDTYEDALSRSDGNRLYYMNWSITGYLIDNRNDTCYAASLLADLISKSNGSSDLGGLSYALFSDLQNIPNMKSLPFGGGCGLLTCDGIAKPAFRVYEMFHKLGTRRLKVVAGENVASGNDRDIIYLNRTKDYDFKENFDISGEKPFSKVAAQSVSPVLQNFGKIKSNINVIAVKSVHETRIIMYNYNRDKERMRAEEAGLSVLGAKSRYKVRIRRVDERHCNPYKTWTEMGSPEYLSESQKKDLEWSSETMGEKITPVYHGDRMNITVLIPPYGVCEVVISEGHQL